MVRKHTIRIFIYRVIAAIGLITALVLNGIASTSGADYFGAWFGTIVDWVLSIDLLVVALAVVTFMLVEAKRLGMKRVWLYFLASGVTAIAFTFPLFMANRERKILENRLAGGSLHRFDFDEHRVDVWVPKVLHSETKILLMHDGRNLFDEGDSFTGKTWEVLTAIKDEVRAEAPIVIGVWGLSDFTRLRELAPQAVLDAHPEIWDVVPPEYEADRGPGMGDAYVSLLADAILPFVAEKFDVDLHPERTAVMGSSMGGLMSMYAMAQRPEVFGTAICFSTHWPFGGDVMVEKLTDMLPSGEKHRVWTDTGTIELDENYPPFHAKAEKALLAKGYQAPSNLVAATFPNTGHHESYWARRVAEALNWWLKAPPRS
jgi:predicted alpha/beta superfamily hydrolase